MSSTKAQQPPIEVTAESLEAVLDASGEHGPDYGILTHKEFFEVKDCIVHPGASGNPDFDWDSLFENCDGGLTDDATPARDISELVVTFGLFLDWLVTFDLSDQRCLKMAAMRTIAMAWVINPKRFDNRSATNIAKQLGINERSFHCLTADFSRRFKIRNVFQHAHGVNKKQEVKNETAT